MPTILSISKENPKEKTKILLAINRPSREHHKHPSKNVLLTKESAEKLIPLLESQGFSVEITENWHQEVDVDLDDFRKLNIDFAKGHIPRFFFYCYKSNYDLSQPYLSIKPTVNNYVLANRSARYRNPDINYAFLKNFNVKFVGLEEEFEDFLKDVPDAEYIKVDNFLELANIIAGCKLFIGNQSFCYSLAEAIKVPRILEICPFAQNVIPHGLNAWDCLCQESFEYITLTEIGINS